MRVGLDARTLASPLRSGVEQYVVHLVRAMSRLEECPEIIAYVNRPIGDSDLAQVANSGCIRTKLIQTSVGWLRAALPWHLWRDRVDLVHLPSTILPPILHCPAVVTVHDLAWWKYPETYSRDDLAMQTKAVALAISRAAHIITTSRSTAGDLHDFASQFKRRTRTPISERLTIIPLGVSPRFSPEGTSLPPDAFPGAERLTQGYILYVGNLQPRKNLPRLLQAYTLVRGQIEDLPLVLAGAFAPQLEQLKEEVRKLDIEDRVIITGNIPEEILPSLYRSATLFVYPSLYEGFGLPVLEAMASGVSVVTSNRSGTAEVAADAALLINPEDTEDIAVAIVKMFKDQGLKANLAERGLKRSREFTWERTARETVQAYRRSVGG